MVAEGDQQLPILARVRVRDGGDVRLRDRMARIGEQRRVQRALDRAGVGRRRQLGPRQIGLEELVADDEPAAGVAVEQMMPAGEPEIVHGVSLRASVTRSSLSSAAGSSSSTSRNENARSGFAPARGLSVRKVSRMAPSANTRCMAISVSGG